MTIDGLIAEMDQALQFPGVSNAWTMPIKARIDMLSTGIRTPVGIKLFGPDLEGLERVAREIEAAVRTVPGTTSVFAERVMGGYYVNIEPDRQALARYGLTVGDVQAVVRSGLGAEAVTTTVEGRERYTVNVRYPQAYRADPQSMAENVLIALPGRRLHPARPGCQGHARRRGRPASAPRTRSSSSTSSSTSATATSAATSPTPRRSWRSG